MQLHPMQVFSLYARCDIPIGLFGSALQCPDIQIMAKRFVMELHIWNAMHMDAKYTIVTLNFG